MNLREILERNNRYQNQIWYVRLWRRRWLLTVPFVAVRLYVTTNWDNLTFAHAWSIAIGLAHVNMCWVYSMQELKHVRDKK